jgi:hypothetical protein
MRHTLLWMRKRIRTREAAKGLKNLLVFCLRLRRKIDLTAA